MGLKKKKKNDCFHYVSDNETNIEKSDYCNINFNHTCLININIIFIVFPKWKSQ